MDKAHIACQLVRAELRSSDVGNVELRKKGSHHPSQGNMGAYQPISYSLLQRPVRTQAVTSQIRRVKEGATKRVLW